MIGLFRQFLQELRHPLALVLVAVEMRAKQVPSTGKIGRILENCLEGWLAGYTQHYLEKELRLEEILTYSTYFNK